MRSTGPFSQYNRAVAMRKLAKPDSPDSSLPVDKSLLGIFGAGEAQLLVEIPRWAGVTEAVPVSGWWTDLRPQRPLYSDPAGRISADPANRAFFRPEGLNYDTVHKRA